MLKPEHVDRYNRDAARLLVGFEVAARTFGQRLRRAVVAANKPAPPAGKEQT